MLPKPDLTFKEVNPPHKRWCTSGHEAPEMFAREGPGTEKTLTRFFRVSNTNNKDVNGTYCEPCVIVANALARKNRSNQMRHDVQQ